MGEITEQKINDIENRVRALEVKLRTLPCNRREDECSVLFKKLENNQTIMLEMHKAELQWLEGLAKFFKYKENLYSEEELGINPQPSNEGGEKKDE
jgi:hypothetical protein